MTTTPEVQAAVERVTALSAGNKSWAKHAATPQQSYDLIEDAKAIDNLLHALAEANERARRWADLADQRAEAMGDLQLSISASKARVAALEGLVRDFDDFAQAGDYFAYPLGSRQKIRQLLNPQQEGSRDHG